MKKWLFLIVLFSGMAQALPTEQDQAVLGWNVPTTYANGKPIPESLSPDYGYYVYYRTPEGEYSNANRYRIKGLSSNTFPTSSATELGDGDYYFALTAYDDQDNESGLSQELLVPGNFIPRPIPATPTNLRILSP